MSQNYLFFQIGKVSFIFDFCLTVRLIHAVNSHPQLSNLQPIISDIISALPSGWRQNRANIHYHIFAHIPHICIHQQKFIVWAKNWYIPHSCIPCTHCGCCTGCQLPLGIMWMFSQRLTVWEKQQHKVS